MRAYTIAAGLLPVMVPFIMTAHAGSAADMAQAKSASAHPLIIRIPPPERAPARGLRLRLEPRYREDGDGLAPTTLSIGPLTARLGGTSKKLHIARYRLEGLNVLGGSVSGTLDSRGARLYVRWPPSDADE